jgi:hypothetical protein
MERCSKKTRWNDGWCIEEWCDDDETRVGAVKDLGKLIEPPVLVDRCKVVNRPRLICMAGL